MVDSACRPCQWWSMINASSLPRGKGASLVLVWYLLKGRSEDYPEIRKMIEPSYMGMIVSDDVFGACPARLLRWKGLMIARGQFI